MSQSTPRVYHHGRRRNPQVEAEWRKVLARWRASGLAARSYCRRRGLSEARFYFWRKELARREDEQPRGGGNDRGAAGVSGFVELRPLPAPPQLTGQDGCPLELLLPEGTRLLIRRGCEGGLLGTVLQVLNQGREGRAC